MAALTIIATAGICAHAQELPDAPKVAVVSQPVNVFGDETHTESQTATLRVSEPRKTAKHRFFDRTSLMLTGMETAAMLADGVTTQNRLGQARTEFRMVNGVMTPLQMQLTEAHPIGKLFVNHGWPGTIAGGAMNVGADLGLRYLLHRTNHHRLERVVPMLFTASSALAAIHNTKY